MWLIIRPMDVKNAVNTIKKIPIISQIETINYKEKGNQGISTIPNHWGLVFKTKNDKYISLQYPPVALQKAENKEHAIVQILKGSHKNNYYYDEENMKKVFKGLKIINQITLKELYELANNSHKKKYNALDGNCQKFACNIIQSLTGINADEIRLNENIFRKGYSEEEEKIMNLFNFSEIVAIARRGIEFFYINYPGVSLTRLTDIILNIIYVIMFYEAKNHKHWSLIKKNIQKILPYMVDNFARILSEEEE